MAKVTQHVGARVARVLHARRLRTYYVLTYLLVGSVLALGVHAALRRNAVALVQPGEQVLVCGLEEGEDHTHGPGCYEFVAAEESAEPVAEPAPEEEPAPVSEPAPEPASEPSEPAQQEVVADGDQAAASAAEPAEPDVPMAEAAPEDAASSTDATETVEAPAKPAEPSENPAPAQEFEAALKDAQGHVVLRVTAKAPEGALPAGSTMRVKPLDARQVEGLVSDAVAEKTDGAITQVQAVDIAFLDKAGREVEPAAKVTVTMASELIATYDEPLVVHVDDRGQADVVDTLTDRELARRSEHAEEDELVFDAEQFSTYAIVITTLHETLTASDGTTYGFTVDVPAAAEVPQGAELVVREVVEGTADYEAYAARAAARLGASDPTQIAFARFFDLSIEVDGQTVQPKVPVQVRAEVTGSEELAAAANPEGSVLHFAEGAAEPDLVPAAMDQEAGTANFEAVGFSVWGIVYTVDFAYEGHAFSIPGGTYVWLSDVLEELAIDFGVQDLEAVAFSDPSLLGVEQVFASSLPEEERDADLPAYDWRLTSLAPFTSQEYLTLTAKDGTMHRIPVADDQEEANPDSIYRADLADLLANLELYIDGELVQDGQTVDVRDGMLYDLVLTFKEDSTKQFSNDDQLYFDLPKGFELPEGWQDKLTVNLGLDGKVYNNALSYAVNEDGSYRLLLDWNRLDRRFERLEAAGNLRFNLHIQGYVNPGEVSYPGYFTITANRYDPHNASVTKSGVLNADDLEHQTITYTVKVLSDGTNEEILLTDVLGSALSYVMKDGVPDVSWQRETTMSSQQTERTTSEAQVGTASSATDPYIRNTAEGFAITIPDMHDGDVYTFTYKADVDYTKIASSGNATAEEMANTAEIFGDSDPTDNKSVYHQKEVVFSDLVKGVEGPGKRYVEGDKEYQDLTWTIDTNRYLMISFRGSDIVDEAHVYTEGYYDSSGTYHDPVVRDDVPLEYTGAGITVEVWGWDETGENKELKETRIIPWSQLETSADLDATQGWTYHVPEDDDIYEYKVTYQTRAEVTGLSSDVLVQNAATSKGGTDQASKLLHPKGNGLGVGKRVVAQTEEDVTWEITVYLDDIAEGFNQQLVVEDLLPHKYLPKKEGTGSDLYKDTYIEGSLEVVGLQQGESYDVTVSQKTGWTSANTPERAAHRYPGNDNDTFKGNESNRNVVYVEFFQNEEKTVQGLGAPADGGDSRTITIRLKTATNQDWVSWAWEKYGYTSIWNGLRHQNDVYANTAHENAEVVCSGKYLVKAFKEKPTWTTRDIWRFETYISGKQPGSTIVIEDYFDTSLWKFYTDRPAILGNSVQFRAGSVPHYASSVNTTGGGYWKVGEYGSSVEEIEGGVRFTITDLPLKSDGSAYEFYGVNYYLAPKDDEAWAAIQRMALENGGKATFLNTAVSEGMTDSDTYTIELRPEFKPIVKSDPTVPDEQNAVTYEIVLNQQKERLNEGKPITMDDTFENLSVDYATIQIVTEPAGREDQVSYDYSGNTGTFTIPDETKVTITYKARVVPPAGTVYDEQSGEADVTVTNVATMLGWSDGGPKTLKVSKDSGATIWRIRLFKYGSGHMESGLNGVVFGLYEKGPSATSELSEQGKDREGNLIAGEWYNPVCYGPTAANGHAGDPIKFTTTTVWMVDGFIQSELDGYTADQIAALSDNELLARVINGNFDDASYVRAHLVQIDGYADVQLSQAEDGVTLSNEQGYFLKELVEPTGYAKDASVAFYSFSFSDDPSYTNGAWQFYNNDIVKVRNSPADGAFTLKKDLAGNYALSEAQKAALRFTVQKKVGEGWEDVGVEVPVADEGSETTYTTVTELTYDQLKDGVAVTHVGAGTFRVVESTVAGGAAVPASVVHTVSFTEDEVDGDLVGGVVQFEITPEDIANGLEHSFEITNTYTQETVSLHAKKQWLDAEGLTRVPEGAQVTLGVYVLTGGTPAAEPVATVTLDGTPDVQSSAYTGESAAWVAQFAKLPKYDEQGGEISYVVKEIAGPEGYDVFYGAPLDTTNNAQWLALSSATTPVITNRQKTVSLSVSKVWQELSWHKNSEGNNHYAPDGAQVTLGIDYGTTEVEAAAKVAAGARPYKSVTLDGTPDAAGELMAWTATFEGLPKADGTGTPYVWVVAETSGHPGFSPSYGTEGAGYLVLGEDPVQNVVTNVEDSASITFHKIWRQDGMQVSWPGSSTITVGLFANDVLVATYALTPTGIAQNVAEGEEPLPYTLAAKSDAGANDYARSISELPTVDSKGKEVVYSVREIGTLDGYHPASYGIKLSTGNVVSKTSGATDRAFDGEYIVNSAGAALPHTGGPGLAPVYALGLGLVAASAFGFVRSARRRAH